ncbi:MAG: 50S ribosomal protein L20 [Kiritimatiellaceae bacterium]|nr:50S ribosomal protein L20 [Kiritimatiellaceae bacterium]
MPRSTNAPASRRRRKNRLDLAKGFYGNRSRTFRLATEAVDRAQAMAFVHRKQKKRNYRRLWTVRVNAACKANDISYSRFIEGLDKAKITLNRKMLSEIAIYDAAGFTKLIQAAKDAKAASVA